MRRLAALGSPSQPGHTGAPAVLTVIPNSLTVTPDPTPRRRMRSGAQKTNNDFAEGEGRYPIVPKSPSPTWTPGSSTRKTATSRPTINSALQACQLTQPNCCIVAVLCSAKQHMGKGRPGVSKAHREKQPITHHQQQCCPFGNSMRGTVCFAVMHPYKRHNGKMKQ